MIRIVLPAHLKSLANVEGEVCLPVSETPTQRVLLDALETAYPVLRGTIREHGSLKRRAYVRFFACQEDLSHESPDAELPHEVVSGSEPFIVLGAMSGG